MTEVPKPPRLTWKPRNWQKLLFTVIVSSFVLFVLVRYLAGARSLGETLRHAHWQWIWVPLLWMNVNLLFAGYRWYLIIDTTGHRVTFRRVMYAIFATWPLAMITPSRASDLLRAWVIRDTVPMAQGTGTVTVEKVIDLQSLGLYTTVGGLVTSLWFWGFSALAALFVLWTSTLLTLRYIERIAQWSWLQKYQDPIQRFFWVFRDLKQAPHRFLLISVLSLMGWAGAIGMVTSLLWIYDAPITAGQVITLWPIALFAAHIPITFAGMGTRDAAFLSLVWLSSQQTMTQASQASILAATLTYALITIVYPALLGLIPMFRFLRELRSAPEQGEIPR